MIKITRTQVITEEISERKFKQWLREVGESVGFQEDGLNDLDAVKFYLEEESQGLDYSQKCYSTSDIKIEGLDEKKLNKWLEYYKELEKTIL